MGSLVVVVAEDDNGRTAIICAYEMDREVDVEKGLAEEYHVVISERSINGRK